MKMNENKRENQIKGKAIEDLGVTMFLTGCLTVFVYAVFIEPLVAVALMVFGIGLIAISRWLSGGGVPLVNARAQQRRDKHGRYS